MEVLNDFINSSQGNPLKKTFAWNTDVVRYDSGLEQANQILTAPVRHWLLNWPLLSKANRDELLELFNRAHGRALTFRFKDADEYEGSCTIPASTLTYQLTNSYYSGEAETWDEDCIRIVDGTPAISGCTEDCPAPADNTKFCVDDDTGIITIGGAGFAAPKVCTFEYYFLVRFNFDVHTDIMKYADVYSAEALEIIQVRE